MELKNYFAQSANGNIIGNPTVYVYQPDTTTLATGLEDADGNPLSNPFTGGANGLVQFAAPNGNYDLRVTGSGRDYTIQIQCADLTDFVSDAESARDAAQVSELAAEDYKDQAKAAAEASGLFNIYNTKAAADAALASIPADGLVEVLADESLSGARTRYRKESGSLVFKIALEQFTQAGTGAVQRAVQAKLREFVSVKDFGAAGDGVADDTAEIQAALDYVSSVGGELYFPPGTYLTSAKLTISGGGVSLRGSNRGASIIQSSASVGIGTNDTTVRRHCKISGMKVKTTSASAIGIDFTYFSYSDFSFNMIELSGNNSSAFYGVGNVAGSSPYYNTFYQNYLARTSPATTGCVGYKLDQYVSGGTRRGPNSNTFIGGRVSSMLKSVDIQAGNGNTFIGIASESVTSGGYHIWLGSDTPHYTGTATAGAAGSITDAGATFANLANGAVKITGGTGAGQANRTDSNSGTVITASRYWPIKPDATSVYEAYAVTAIGNSFVNFRFEGISGANGIGESPSAYGNEFFGTYSTSLGAGKVFDAAVFPDGDFLGFNSYKTIQAFTFTLDDIAAGLTNQALRAGGGSSTQVLMPFDGDIVGIGVNSSATRSGGKLTVNPTVNGTVISAVSAVLNADVTNNNVQMYPVRSIVIGGKNRRIGAVVTTDESWTPITADISVTVFVLPRG